MSSGELLPCDLVAGRPGATETSSVAVGAGFGASALGVSTERSLTEWTTSSGSAAFLEVFFFERGADVDSLRVPVAVEGVLEGMGGRRADVSALFRRSTRIDLEC